MLCKSIFYFKKLKSQKNRFYRVNNYYLYDSFTNKVYKLPIFFLDYLYNFSKLDLKFERKYYINCSSSSSSGC